VQSLKQEYKQFLADYFGGLKIRTPLFFNWKFGLRFDLQVGETNTDEYFFEVIDRATKLFEASFEADDNLIIVFLDYRYKRRKIRFSNYTFRQIQDLKKSEVNYLITKRLYEPSDKDDIRNIALIKVITNRINYKNILTAIGNTDFPPRSTRLDGNSVLTSKEIYFINVDKKLIFHMYDDRGLDIISANIETLMPIYRKYNRWILENNRSNIDKLFNGT